MNEQRRVLAVIAHHGSKNRQHLDTMLTAFRAMRDAVTVVVVSEAHKDLPADVSVEVGLPTSDPWSLPFAHREIMATRRDDFDLFVYSEDDTMIEQRHLDAHVELSSLLPDNRIPGLQRFEQWESGERSYCSVHSYYRWEPYSIEKHGGHTFAHLTNEHGAAVILTRRQLDRAIASGGFLVAPHHGDYDMLVSAATDVYTQCGMRKLFCLERLEDQLVHHLPNVYLGQLGISEDAFKSQIDALHSIADGVLGPSQLLDPTVNLPTRRWDRHAFPDPSPGLVDLMPRGARTVLSVGTTSGAAEAELVRAGYSVVGIPVDEVVAAVARLQGIATMQPTLASRSIHDLRGKIDVILCLDVLGYLPEPRRALETLRHLLANHGQLVATVPDHDRYAMRNRVRRRAERTTLPSTQAECGLNRTNAAWLRRQISEAGFHGVRTSRRRASSRDPVGSARIADGLLGNTVLARAHALAPSER